jgi:putative PIN family toxin of toxin-antitoxin system
LDSNVIISAMAFGGKPDAILQALLKRQFAHVTCAEILAETQQNLLRKIGMHPLRVRAVLGAILEVSTVIEPKGLENPTNHSPDNVVLETAVLGGCDVLVTGDKRHLLPLNPYKGLLSKRPRHF